MTDDRIISALIGLVGACNNNPKTENTDSVVLKALAFPVFSSNNGAHTVEEIIDEIRTEKNMISPGCATCQMPCGNTSDYDMSRLYNADDTICRVKLQILSALQETAAKVCQSGVSLSETEAAFLYKALSYISYDLKQEVLLTLLDDAKSLYQKTGEK